MTGKLREGVTATDLALHITQMLRAQKVVGKFVEFYGEGAASLPVPDRATIGNMAPEYGATMGFFPVDEESVNYLRATGRTEEQCAAFENYFRAQKMFGMPRQRRHRLQRRSRTRSGRRAAERGRPEAAAGPHQSAGARRDAFARCCEKPVTDGGYGKANGDLGEAAFRATERHAADADGEMASTDKQNQGIEPGDERNKVGDGREPSDAGFGRGNRSETRRSHSGTAKAESATAAF